MYYSVTKKSTQPKEWTSVVYTGNWAKNWDQQKMLKITVWQQVLWGDESARPQQYWRNVGSSNREKEQKAANIQRRALECPSRGLENYSWRLLKKMTESLPKRVQTVLKNKDGHAKYCASTLLQFYKLCLSHPKSIYVCTCAKIKALHLFPVLLVIYKETKAGFRLLHRSACRDFSESFNIVIHPTRRNPHLFSLFYRVVTPFWCLLELWTEPM